MFLGSFAFLTLWAPSVFRFLTSQAQRDFFGAHTYERTDKEGTFHCLWDDTHKDIGDVTGRIAGEL